MNNYKAIFLKKEEILQDYPKQISSSNPSNTGTFLKKPRTVVNLPPFPRKYVRQTNRQESLEVREEKAQQQIARNSQIVASKLQQPIQHNIQQNITPENNQDDTLNQTINSLTTKQKPPTEDFSIFDVLKPYEASKYEYAQSISSGNTSEQYSLIEQDEFLTSFNQRFMNGLSEEPNEETKNYAGLVNQWRKEDNYQSVKIEENGIEKKNRRENDRNQRNQQERWKKQMSKSSESIKIPAPHSQNLPQVKQIPSPNQSMLKSRKYGLQLENYLIPYQLNQTKNSKQDQRDPKLKIVQLAKPQNQQNNKSEIYSGNNQLMEIEQEDSFFECSHTQLSFVNENQSEANLKKNSNSKILKSSGPMSNVQIQSNIQLKSKSKISSKSNIDDRMFKESYEICKIMPSSQMKDSNQMEASNILHFKNQENQMGCSIERRMLNSFTILKQQLCSGHVNNTFSDELKFAHQPYLDKSSELEQNPSLQGKCDSQSSIPNSLSCNPYAKLKQDILFSQQRRKEEMMDSQFQEENPDDELYTVESGYMITEKSQSYIRISDDHIQSQIQLDYRIENHEDQQHHHDGERPQNIFFQVQTYPKFNNNQEESDEMLPENYIITASQDSNQPTFTHNLQQANASQEFYQNHMNHMDQIIIQILQMKKQFQIFYLNSINSQTHQFHRTNQIILKKLNLIQAQLDLSMRQNRVLKHSNLDRESGLRGKKQQNENQILYSFQADKENLKNRRPPSKCEIMHESMQKSVQFSLQPRNQSESNNRVITDSKYNSNKIKKDGNKKLIQVKISQENNQIAKNHINLQHSRHKSLKGSTVQVKDKQNNQFQEKSLVEMQNKRSNNQSENEIMKYKSHKTDKLIGIDHSMTEIKQQKLTSKDYNNKLLEEVELSFKKNREYKRKVVVLQYSSQSSKESIQFNKQSTSKNQIQKFAKYQKYLNQQNQQNQNETKINQNTNLKIHQSSDKEKDSQSNNIPSTKKTSALSSLPSIMKVVTPSQLKLAIKNIETHEEKKQLLLQQVYQFGHPTQQLKSLVLENQKKKEKLKEDQKLQLVEKKQLFNQINRNQIKDSFWCSSNSNKSNYNHESNSKTQIQQIQELKPKKNVQKLQLSESSQSMLISKSNSNSLKNGENNHPTSSSQKKAIKHCQIPIISEQQQIIQDSDSLNLQPKSNNHENRKQSNLISSYKSQKCKKQNLLDSEKQKSDESNLLDFRYRKICRQNENLINSKSGSKSSQESNLSLGEDKQNKKEQNLLKYDKEKKNKEEENLLHCSKETNWLYTQKKKSNSESKNSQQKNLLQSSWGGKDEEQNSSNSKSKPKKAKNQEKKSSVERQAIYQQNPDHNYSATLQNSHNRSLSPLVIVNEQNIKTLPVNLNEISAKENMSMSDDKKQLQIFGLHKTSQHVVFYQTSDLMNTSTILSQTQLQLKSFNPASQSPILNESVENEGLKNGSNENLLILNQKQLDSQIKTPQKQPHFNQLSPRTPLNHHPLQVHNRLTQSPHSSPKSASFAYKSLIQKHISEFKQNQKAKPQEISIKRLSSSSEQQTSKQQPLENQNNSWTGFKELRQRIIKPKQTTNGQDQDSQQMNSLQFRTSQSIQPINLSQIIHQKTESLIIPVNSLLSDKKNLSSLSNTSQNDQGTDKSHQSLSQQLVLKSKFETIQKAVSKQEKQYLGKCIYKNQEANRQEQLESKGIKQHKIPVISFDKKLKQGHFCRGQTRRIPTSIYLNRNIQSPNNSKNESNQQNRNSNPNSQTSYYQNIKYINLQKTNNKDTNTFKFNSLPHQNQSLQILPDSPLYRSIYYDQTDHKTMTYKWFKFNPNSF